MDLPLSSVSLIRDLLKGEISFLVVDNLDSSPVLFAHADLEELGMNLFRE
jgi:hypothetical protein